MTTTKQDINNRLSRLSEIMYGQADALRISEWAPGDGWTRYQIITKDNQPAFRSERYYRKNELYEALGLALNVAYTMNGQN